jgi:hypothetical protein
MAFFIPAVSYSCNFYPYTLHLVAEDFIQITSSMLFYLLEKHYTLTYLSGGSGSMVSSALLLDTDRPEPDFLYISGSLENLRRITEPVSCSFLLTGPVGYGGNYPSAE